MNPRTESSPEPQVARDATYHRAPEALRQRVRASLAEVRRAERAGAWRTVFAMAASFGLVAVVSWNAALFHARGVADEAFEREVVTAHVRSLQSDTHFNDVVSTDQHTVKPWFTGRIDFAPPVADYAAAGFSLVGGRLDYLEGHNVAAITYHRRLHRVNLFVWPAAGESDAQPSTASRNGFAIVRWTRGGLRFAAVADIAPAELAALPDLVGAPRS
jgi:anti-sigma factor RsiW